jgi:rare lipoprotein A
MYKYLKGLLLVASILLGYQEKVFSQSETGLASWYGPGLHENTTAGGEVFDMNELTAAHPTLPFDTRVKVTNLRNKRTVIVRINDRGPFIKKRIIDVSMEAARRLEIINSGVAKVRVEVVDDVSAEDEPYTISSDSSSIKSTQIPITMLESIHREAFPLNKLNRDISEVIFGEAAGFERPDFQTN